MDKFERTYVDMIAELRNAVESDIIPKDERKAVDMALDILAMILWKYSG